MFSKRNEKILHGYPLLSGVIVSNAVLFLFEGCTLKNDTESNDFVSG